MLQEHLDGLEECKGFMNIRGWEVETGYFRGGGIMLQEQWEGKENRAL